MVETLAYIWEDVRKHNANIGAGGTLDVPLSSARSHSCTPLGMAAVFSERLKSQAEKEALPPGQSFAMPADERVPALAAFKAISEFHEMNEHGSDAADVRQEMLPCDAPSHAHAAAAAVAAAVEGVVDREMVRQLSMARSQRVQQSQLAMSQRRGSGVAAGGWGGSQSVGMGGGIGDVGPSQSQAGGELGFSQQGVGGFGVGRSSLATPHSQEVLDVFAWMAAEDAQDESPAGGGCVPWVAEEEAEEEEEEDPVRERVRELQMRADLRDADDILKCTQVCAFVLCAQKCVWCVSTCP